MVSYPLTILFAPRYCCLRLFKTASYSNVLKCSFCLLQENVNLVRAGAGVSCSPSPSPDAPIPGTQQGAWLLVGRGEWNAFWTPHPGESASAVCWCCPLVALGPHRTWLFPAHPVGLLTSHPSSPGPESVISGGGRKASLVKMSAVWTMDSIREKTPSEQT